MIRSSDATRSAAVPEELHRLSVVLPPPQEHPQRVVREPEPVDIRNGLQPRQHLSGVLDGGLQVRGLGRGSEDLGERRPKPDVPRALGKGRPGVGIFTHPSPQPKLDQLGDRAQQRRPPVLPLGLLDELQAGVDLPFLEADERAGDVDEPGEAFSGGETLSYYCGSSRPPEGLKHNLSFFNPDRSRLLGSRWRGDFG